MTDQQTQLHQRASALLEDLIKLSAPSANEHHLQVDIVLTVFKVAVGYALCCGMPPHLIVRVVEMALNDVHETYLQTKAEVRLKHAAETAAATPAPTPPQPPARAELTEAQMMEVLAQFKEGSRRVH